MYTATYQQFFLEPDDSWQRRYEALRALFVDQHPPKHVARHFGVSHGTLSNWASEFRAQCDTGAHPPFSFNPNAADQLDQRILIRLGRI